MRRAAIGRVLSCLCLGLSIIALSACDTGLRQMGPSEYGVVFRKLPPIVGGGVSSKVLSNAQKVIVWPWDTIYRFDVSEKYITWGGGAAAEKHKGDLVYTRAADGNEVALAVTVSYQVMADPAKLVTLVTEVATSDDEVRSLIVSTGRADIRTYMNHLRTAEFASVEARYKAVADVKRSMNDRLNRYGIEILRVNLDDFQFERLLPDGSVDSSYQEKLTQIQKLHEDTNREISRRETIRAKKQKEYNDSQAKVNQRTAEADGYRNQAKLRGDGYLEAKRNDAKAILAKGQAEAEAVVQQISALSGPGGQALLKLELVKALIARNPQFVLLDSGKGSNELGVRRTDTNELLNQIGVLEGLKERTGSEPPTALAHGDQTK